MKKKIKYFVIIPLTILITIAISYKLGANHGYKIGYADSLSEQIPHPTPVIPETETVIKQTQPSDNITLNTYSYSYYALNDNGNLVLENGLPYSDEQSYHFSRELQPNSTALIVIDPWIDSPSEFLNEYYGEVIDKRIIPMVNRSLELNIPIIVFTNDPNIVSYNTKIPEDLDELVTVEKVTLLYHQDYATLEFTNYLRGNGINALIYTGFASNMCVIGRPIGMIAMVEQGFKTYFIPEASAAMEFSNTWDSQQVHQTTTGIISQWIAEIIPYNEFMQTTE